MSKGAAAGFVAGTAFSYATVAAFSPGSAPFMPIVTTLLRKRAPRAASANGAIASACTTATGAREYSR